MIVKQVERLTTTFLNGRRGQELVLILRFGLAGVFNTGFSYIAFALTLLVGANAMLAVIVSGIAGIALNYQVARRLVFRSPGRAFRFFLVYIIALGINWVGLTSFRTYGFGDMLSQAMLALPIAAISFIGQRLFVFGRPQVVRTEVRHDERL